MRTLLEHTSEEMGLALDFGDERKALLECFVKARLQLMGVASPEKKKLNQDEVDILLEFAEEYRDMF